LRLEELHSAIKKCLGESAATVSGGGERICLSVEGSRRDIAARVADFCKSDWRQHLVLTYGVADTPEEAERLARDAAYKGWTVPMPDPLIGKSLDVLDHCRPATEEVIGPENRKIRISKRTSELRQHGAGKRPNFRLMPPKSFEEIVADPPDGLPDAVIGKIAVVYADGSGFGKVAEEIGGERFSAMYEAACEGLGQHLADWVEASGPWGMNRDRSRFETLIWGGDDMTFVMPAWLVVPFLAGFTKAVSDWDFEGQRVKFRCGAIIAHHKVPIRQLRALAYDAQDCIRAANFDGSGISIDVFESAAPPFGGIEAYRRALYGPMYTVGSDAIPAEGLGSLQAAAVELVSDTADGTALTSRKLFDLLASLRKENLTVCDPCAEDCVRAAGQDYFARLAGVDDSALDHWNSAFGSNRPLPLALAQMAQLRPYLIAANQMAKAEEGTVDEKA
jgi:hypothetical protein